MNRSKVFGIILVSTLLFSIFMTSTLSASPDSVKVSSAVIKEFSSKESVRVIVKMRDEGKTFRVA